MPVTRSALKKLRQDKKRQKLNLLVKRRVKEIVSKFKKSPTKKLLSEVFSVLDQAAKKKIYHANKVGRLKGRLAKLLGKKTDKTNKATISTSKKTSPKKKKTIV